MEVIEGEKLVSLLNSVKVLLDKLGSTEFHNNYRRMKLNESLTGNLKNKLAKILIALNDDADIVNDTLRYALFEVENLIDEINTEALRRKVKADEYQIVNSTSQQLNIGSIGGISGNTLSATRTSSDCLSELISHNCFAAECLMQ
ncbi:NB-ARC domain disease resistance protein [Trifolium pratense]|uniref:NB-ARC domain disease resistance protein n=1 Tax=Trifolium pratense TaxID=57577 RepID=A0A2K3KY85_TRIPR|nr:NB-ARC domain disease resistance protein [Trifolium pratense]